jgi:hypothetical protein
VQQLYSGNISFDIRGICIISNFCSILFISQLLVSTPRDRAAPSVDVAQHAAVKKKKKYRPVDRKNFNSGSSATS